MFCESYLYALGKNKWESIKSGGILNVFTYLPVGYTLLQTYSQLSVNTIVKVFNNTDIRIRQLSIIYSYSTQVNKICIGSSIISPIMSTFFILLIWIILYKGENLEAERILMQMLCYADSTLTLQVCPCRCFISKSIPAGPFHGGRGGERGREERRRGGERKGRR